MARAYYNEFDRDAAHVLCCLIADGLIAPGDVDDRSIKDVQPNDLEGYTQVHLFAGAGIWSLAARLAGWADARPLWTASCPCQPFSAAGKGLGIADPRHLWPDVFRLLRARRRAGFGPSVLVGEQVAGKTGYGWFDGVRADLASEGIPSRVVDFPACAVDSPQIRNRLYWAALGGAASAGGLGSGRSEAPGRQARDGQHRGSDAGDGHVGRAIGSRLEGQRGHGDGSYEPGRVGADTARSTAEADVGDRSRDVVDGPSFGRGEGRPEHELRSGRAAVAGSDAPVSRDGSMADSDEPFGRIRDEQSAWKQQIDEQDVGAYVRTRSRNGSFWSDAEWIMCHDGKARRTEPGIRLLVTGMAGRVPAWRLAGNSIVAQAAAEVIASLMDVLPAWQE